MQKDNIAFAVLSDLRIWIVIDNVCKITKLIGRYAKIIDHRQNWN